jgi:hypothetical protein
MVSFPFSMGTLTCERGVAGQIMMRIQLVWLLLLLLLRCSLPAYLAAAMLQEEMNGIYGKGKR